MTPIDVPTPLKMLMITAVSEDAEVVKQCFKAADVQVYSSMDIQGHYAKPDGKPLTSWFAMPMPGMDAALYFAFIPDEEANLVAQHVREANKANKTAHPIRVFIMAAEQMC